MGNDDRPSGVLLPFARVASSGGRRIGRPRLVRAKTESLRKPPKRVYLKLLASPLTGAEHPKTRGECENGPRPCPLVGCRYNLFLDVNEVTGSIKYNFPDREPEDMPAEESCALDVADRGEISLEEVGQALNIVRERSRQIEEKALRAIKRRPRALADYAVHGKKLDSQIGRHHRIPIRASKSQTVDAEEEQEAIEQDDLRDFVARVFRRYDARARPPEMTEARMLDGPSERDRVTWSAFDLRSADAWADRVIEALRRGEPIGAAIDAANATEPESSSPVPLTPGQQRVYDVIARNPGLKVREIAAELSGNRLHAYSHLKALRDLGVILQDDRGRYTVRA